LRFVERATGTHDGGEAEEAFFLHPPGGAGDFVRLFQARQCVGEVAAL
jgi:hypothetical protein